MWKIGILILAQASTSIIADRTVGPIRDADMNRIVCVNVTEIGSRLNRRRICRTRAEWAELQAQGRLVVDRVQQFKPCLIGSARC